MPTTTKKKKTKQVDYSKKIIDAFKDYFLLNGESPPSVYAFSKSIKITEDRFYDHFGSFRSVKQAIWEDYISQTLDALQKDSGYKEFSVKEKLLSFYYTLLEVLRSDRSFVMLCFNHIKKNELTPDFLKKFKSRFDAYANELINEGVESNEVQDRPVIGKRYKEALWLQLMFLINFWIKDDSSKFEQTDAAVEKAVSLSFDLMGPGPLDTMIDFAKFLYHYR
ncbi:MAG: TetR family transcriptional regulator C-terminal domain-containing protein [Fulvivirga sp.]|nr:TetR family transcriptional regulator C-terminal domain-containing protein [Fulvivirga sp.]